MSIDYDAMSDAELLRESIRETRDAAATYRWDDQTLAFALGQMYAGAVRGNPALERVWQFETAPTQARLELNLTEGTVDGHLAPADTLAKLITGVSEATKEVAKKRLGRKRYSSPVLARGVGQGSVRVVLEIQHHKHDNNPESMGELSTVDSESLRTVASVLANADDMSEDSPLTAQIRQLPPHARRGLVRAAKQIADQQWHVVGRVAQRGFDPAEVSLTPAGARRLELELKSAPITPKPATLFGQVVGTIDIEGIVWFKPEGDRRVRAVAMDPDVAQAALALQPGHPRVRGEFLVYEALPAGGEVLSRSWELTSVDPAPDAGHGEQDELEYPAPLEERREA